MRFGPLVARFDGTIAAPFARLAGRLLLTNVFKFRSYRSG